jgi:hypothetical protein
LTTPLLIQTPPSPNVDTPPPLTQHPPSPSTLAHIYKDNNKEKIKVKNTEIDEEFELFWKSYDKNIDRKKTFIKWKLISKKDKVKILEVIDDYVKATPEQRFRKNPYNYLSSEGWNDTIIPPFNPDQKMERKPIDNKSFEVKIPEGW